MMVKTPRKQWRSVWHWLIDPRVLEKGTTRRQAQLLSAMLFSLVSLGLLAAMLPRIFDPQLPIGQDTGFFLTVAAAAVLAGAFLLNRYGRYTVAVLIAVLMLMLLI